MSTLITGIGGFIGSHVAESLLRRGDSVVGIDILDNYYDPAIKRRNLAEIARSGSYEFSQTDIRGAAAIENIFEKHGIRRVIHLAARAGVRPSLRAPALYADVNIHGTAVLLEAAARHGVESFVFASSSSVYGARTDGAFVETDIADSPASPYGATKRAAELVCSSFHATAGLPITCLRFFTAYGPRQRPEMAIHLFARQIIDDTPLTLFGDGTTRRDYTYIGDVAAGVVAAHDRPNGFEIYNIGCTEPVLLTDVVGTLERVIGKQAQITSAPDQPGDVPYTCSDVSKARRDLGYAPTTGIEQGVDRFVAWLRDHE